MKLRFLFVRAAAGTLAVGSAAPVNVPFAVQAQLVETASAGAPARATTRLASIAPQEDVDAGDLRRDAQLKIGAHGELPCDSGEWANNSLFGPRAQVLAALGIAPKGSSSAGRETALADALGDTPTGNAESSAFGSIFGNAPFSGGSGDLFGLGGGGTSGTGGQGGSTGGSGTGGTGIGGGGTTTGGGSVTGGGTAPGGSTGGTGTTGGSTGGDTDGGTGSTGGGPTDPVTGGGTAPSGPGDASGGGTTGGTTPPPIDTSPPTNPGTGDGHGGGNSTVPPANPPAVTGAVPEPASWAAMLFGFGAIGAMMRIRRRREVSPARTPYIR